MFLFIPVSVSVENAQAGDWCHNHGIAYRSTTDCARMWLMRESLLVAKLWNPFYFIGNLKRINFTNNWKYFEFSIHEVQFPIELHFSTKLPRLALLSTRGLSLLSTRQAWRRWARCLSARWYTAPTGCWWCARAAPAACCCSTTAAASSAPRSSSVTRCARSGRAATSEWA